MARADTMRQGAWRIQVLQADETVSFESLWREEDEPIARRQFLAQLMHDGVKKHLQHRAPGTARFVTVSKTYDNDHESGQLPTRREADAKQDGE